MELNREQIIKALERNMRISIDLCYDCPRITYSQLREALALIKELTHERTDHLSLIDAKDVIINDLNEKHNRLIEENERLAKQCGEIIVECDKRDAERLKQVAELTKENERLKSVEFTCGFVKPHKVLECPIFDEITRARADTAREIFEEIEKYVEVALMNGHIETPILCIGYGTFAELKKKYLEESK